MWKKEEAQKDPVTGGEGSPTPTPTPKASPRSRSEGATIGPSIAIRGDVTGDEDLVIEGRVEGSVDLKQHSVTVGPEGEVKADISGKVVTIEGKVEGDLRADEQVILRNSARVQGDIWAPRVMLEDGAYLRGGVEMGETEGPGRTEQAARRSAEKETASQGGSRTTSETATSKDGSRSTAEEGSASSKHVKSSTG